MHGLVDRFQRMFDDVASRSGVTVSAREIRPGLPEVELREMEEGLEIELAPAIREFYRQTSGISFLWSVAPGALGDGFDEEDAGYVGGNIAVLDLFTMVMGRGGRRWFGELFFDHMSEDEQALFRRFVPFDHTGELAPGFLLADGRIGPEMKLFSANDGIVPFDYDIDHYLERCLETRGFHYWPTFFGDSHSHERIRYDRAISRIFI